MRAVIEPESLRTLKNRRNYYRVLQVQPDAAPDVIRASYRILMQKLKIHPDLGGDDWNAAVVNEAYNVLCDRDRRAAYDAEQRTQFMDVGSINRSSGTRTGAGRSARRDPFAARNHGKSAFEPMICVLCHQLTNIALALPGPRRCHACRSPLTRVDSVVPGDAGKRALPRLERSAPIRYLRTGNSGVGNDWYNPELHHALLEDLSPKGMRLVTETALDVGELLRIECDLLSAVARVVVSRASEDTAPHFVVGTEFITVDFAHQQGSLFAEQA